MSTEKVFDPEAVRVIEALGGTSETAKLCEIFPQAVSQWKKDGIPKPWRKYFQAIRPDLFRTPTRRVQVASLEKAP